MFKQSLHLSLGLLPRGYGLLFEDSVTAMTRLWVVLVVSFAILLNVACEDREIPTCRSSTAQSPKRSRLTSAVA